MERNEFIDIAKGIGMLLIIIGHLGVFSGIWVYPIYIISLFHVAFFFFISGLFLNPNKRDFKSFVLSKFRRLIKPYFIYGFLALITYLIVTPNLVDVNLKEQFIHYLLGMRLNNTYIFTGALWFLTCLFITSIISFLVVKLPSPIQTIFVVLSLFLCWYNSCKSGLVLPLNMDVSFFMTPIMILAFSVKKYIVKIVDEKSYKWKLSLLCILVCCVYLLVLKYFAFKTVDPYSNSFGIAPLTFLCSIAGFYVVFHVTSIITYRAHIGLKSAIRYIGKNSIIYLVIHQQLILHPLNCYDLMSSSNLINGVIRLSIILIFCTLASFFINKKMSWSIK